MTPEEATRLLFQAAEAGKIGQAKAAVKTTTGKHTSY
jgi:hypothetical protein